MDKKITARDVIAAIRQNGLRQIRNGSYYEYDEDDRHIIGGCAFGQAALNLGVDVGDLHTGCTDFNPDRREEFGGFSLVIQMNDNEGKNLDEIADYLQEYYKNNLDSVISI